MLQALPGSLLPAASSKIFELLVASVRDYAIFMLDPTGHVATWNAGAERFKGYQANEIIGRHFSTFYPPEEIRAGKCEMELEVAAREGHFEDEGWRVRKDGSQFWANVVITAVRDASGALLGFSKVTRDLTERRRNEEERAARLAAEQANRTKDEFLAMLGHELRNPLAPIVTALQLIKLRGDTTSKREYAVIERQVDHLMHLVGDLFDVSRIARGTIELKRRRLELRELLAKAIETATPLFEQRRHHLALEVPDHPIAVDGDEERVIQIFTNLLTNAAKYTDPGGHVKVVAQVHEGDVTIDVIDDGTGISKELLPRVFDLFVQGRQDSDRATGGLGLGLALASSLVRLHGGTLAAHSEGCGRGSRFTVTLPMASAEVASPAPKELGALPLPPGASRVLLVDDNDDACTLLAEILIAVGHDVRTAPDGPTAFEVVREFTPDVAILDIGLPGMDGYELAGRLRELVPRTRMIALSGYGQDGDRERSQAAGFASHFVKPVEIRRLLDGIRELSPRAD